jgi:hypothetical protein
MVDLDFSPASVPIFNPTWSEYQSSKNTNLKESGRIVRFEQSSSFRFERATEEFDSGSYRIDLKIHYTNTSYPYVCFGVACEKGFVGDKGIYYFKDSIMYSSYYPKVTCDQKDLDYDKFSVKNQDLISIIFDIDNSTIQFIHNEKELREAKLSNLDTSKSWYFVVGMFEGEVEIVS